MSNKKIVVYLDRDGVINDNSQRFVNSVSDFEFILSSPYAIKKLNDAGILTVVVTNQGGIEAGHLTKEQFLEITTYMHNQLKKFNAKVDHIYYSESHDNSNYYRKPNPGMIIESSKELKLEKYTKYMVGDRVTDVMAGNRSDCTTILVKTGEGRNQISKIKSLIQTPDHICENLNAAVKWIFEQENIK